MHKNKEAAPTISPEAVELRTQSAREVIGNRQICWHGLRGYDFAGLESILQSGLTPAVVRGHREVCLSASPALSHENNRPADTFFAYSMQDGLSLAVDNGRYYAYATNLGRDCGGFVDEVRAGPIAPDRIEGVMMCDHNLKTPLAELASEHEPRQADQCRDYIERTIDHLERLGLKLEPNKLPPEVTAALETDLPLGREQNAGLERFFLDAYSRVMESEYGLKQPTVEDMLSITLARTSNSEMSVYVYDQQIKDDIGRVNNRLPGRRPGGNREDFEF